LSFDDPRHSVDAALEQWVEKGSAPAAIIAAKYNAEDKQHPTMTRPLCAYPQTARYEGSGDINDAANFRCEAAKK
jgi:feruloyl esterase